MIDFYKTAEAIKEKYTIFRDLVKSDIELLNKEYAGKTAYTFDVKYNWTLKQWEAIQEKEIVLIKEFYLANNSIDVLIAQKTKGGKWSDKRRIMPLMNLQPTRNRS